MVACVAVKKKRMFVSRSCCAVCLKPLPVCICHLFVKTVNRIKLVVLQHPKEVGHSKGSLPLLLGSLTNIEVLEGECFDGNDELQEIINHYQNRIILLYPSDNAKLVNDIQIETEKNSAVDCIILLDATWRKAYKMFQSSAILQTLPTAKLPEDVESHYLIRKTKKDNALSTLEAACIALATFEQSDNKYQPLINSFRRFNEIQLSYRTKKESDN